MSAYSNIAQNTKNKKERNISKKKREKSTLPYIIIIFSYLYIKCRITLKTLRAFG